MIFVWNLDCAKITLKRGKLIFSQNLVIDNNRNTRAGTRKNVQVPRD
jgi:hypothetical protein